MICSQTATALGSQVVSRTVNRHSNNTVMPTSVSTNTITHGGTDVCMMSHD